jgi:hypothetical protein
MGWLQEAGGASGICILIEDEVGWAESEDSEVGDGNGSCSRAIGW